MKNQSKKTLADIEREYTNEHSAMLKSLGIFFAFTSERFNEQRQDGVKYYSTGANMYIPTDRFEEYKKQSKELADKYKKLRTANSSMDNFIHETLNNQEGYYSGDLEETLEIVKDTFPECTYEDVNRIYNKNLDKYE